MQTHALSAVRCPLKSYAAVPRLALAPRDLKILIVNEDMRCADSLKRTLQGLGYSTTFTAYTAQRALAAVADFSPRRAWRETRSC
jgi:PleD family two-component response regulator